MWKMSDRELPTGLLIDGGSDWFCLNHKFIEYILTSTDSYLNTLKEFYNYTLLPSEVAFNPIEIKLEINFNQCLFSSRFFTQLS